MKPNPHPKIRDARPGDAAACALLVQTVFEEYGMTFELDGWDKDLLAPHLHYASPRAMFRVADLDGKIIGMAGAHLEEAHAELHRLYISRAMRGHGLGALLCQEVEEWVLAKKIERLTLWSDVRFTHAHALYRRLGYQIFASRIIDDPDRSVEFGMERNLKATSAPASAPLCASMTASLRALGCVEASADAQLWHKVTAAAAITPGATALLAAAKQGVLELLIAGNAADTIVAGFAIQTKTGARESLLHPSCKP